VARMREVRCDCRVSVGSHEGKSLLGRPRRRWEGNKWSLGKWVSMGQTVFG
jgi:hypothetical protein